MKIQFKLILVGFVVIAVLMTVVGFLGISATNEVAERFDEIADETAPALLALGKIETSVSKIHTEAVSFAYIDAELALTEEGAAAAAAAAAEISELEEAKEALEFWEEEFAKVAEDEVGQGFVEEIEEHEVSLYNAALALVRAKQEGKQGQIMLDLKEKLEREEEDFDELINRVIENEKGELVEQDEATAAASAAAGRILTVGVIASALLALFMGVFVSRSVAKPLARLRDVADAVARGDLTKRAEVKRKDEIGQLAASFNAMTESLLEAQKLPRSILRSMKDSLFVVDTKGNITEVNRAALEALGYKKEELVGAPISKVFGTGASAKPREIDAKPKVIKYIPDPEQELDEESEIKS
jgi:HAMP domain-containing protein